MKTRILSVLILSALAVAACHPKGGASQQQDKVETEAEGPVAFPPVSVPAMYDTEEGRDEYLVEHFWDSYFNHGGVTDSATVLGVSKGEVEQAFSNYTRLLGTVPMKEAQAGMAHLFDKIAAAQAADTTSLVYLQMTDIVSRYLYDPNSPVRNEDYYLPFVSRMAASKFTAQGMKAAYEYETRMCSLNQFGTQVHDLAYKTVDGRRGNLFSIKADYTILFFSNPGCQACKDIIADIRSRQYIDQWISDGKLAVFSLYIDEEVNEWREYVPKYPSDWICGYDYTFSVWDNGEYNIRAIPSLYLLDKDKKVIFKDAPTQQVLAYLDNLNNLQQ